MFARPGAPHTQGARNRKIILWQNELFEVIYKSFYWLKTQNGRSVVIFIVIKTHFRALRARGAHRAILSHDMIIFIARRFQPNMLLARQFLQKTTVARGPRTGLFARKHESIEFSEFKFGI